MQIKLFGKQLFESKKSRQDLVWTGAEAARKESKYLPDFHRDERGGIEFELLQVSSGGTAVTRKNKKIDKKKVSTKVPINPKKVFDLKLLHDKSFKLNADPKYVDQQISDFKDKLTLINAEEWDVRRGVDEINSVVMRLENRKKYPDNQSGFADYPYTTGSKIAGVLKKHDNLQLGKIAQFIADLPKEAVDVMKSYNKATEKLCGKQAVFYIIADKKDFKKTDSRKDPILLAQSPYGHFWQILGAWDKEMMFIEEL